MAPSTHGYLATSALLVLTSMPLMARAARLMGGSLSASASESEGSCGCGRARARRCSCDKYLEEAGIDLVERAAEICPKAMRSSGRIRSQNMVSKYPWGKVPKPFFDRFQGMMNFGDEIENDKCLKPGTCFPELLQACSTHYGCNLTDAPEKAWGLCDKVFATKEWEFDLASLNLLRYSRGNLWCSEDHIEAFCRKTRADIPELPNACSRRYADFEGREEDICPKAFKYESSDLPEPTKAQQASAPPQFRRALPNVLGLAKHMERKKKIPKGTCYPWFMHVCKKHYQKKGCELGEMMPQACEFAFRRGRLDLESTAQALFGQGHWCSAGDLKQACSKHFGCELADAPEKAWGLCDNVFVTKDWTYESGPAQLFRKSEGKLWCSVEDIEGFCNRTKADVPQFPNECSRKHSDLKAPEICPNAFKYEGRRGTKLPKATKGEVSSAPVQFEAFVPNLLGVAQHWEQKSRLPKGTCYPWLLHVCAEHYSQKGCELDEDRKHRVCAMAGKRSAKVAAVALFNKAALWCSELDIKKVCGQK